MENLKNDLGSSSDSLADESIVLEESPCRRWSKRKKVLGQKDLVPGVDSAYLAIDAEEGVEVVWNEVLLTSKPAGFTERVISTFDQLIRLNHPNIVRFHRHWIKDDKLIFITEYITSNTLKQYLKMTRKNMKKLSMATWKKFCMQLLHALHYLHSRLPCIVHGNLCCDSIYVRHNGLLKIGSISAEAILKYSSSESSQCFHLVGSEFSSKVTTGVDIFAFGVCALEMATLETSDTSSLVPVDQTRKMFDSLDNDLQRQLIQCCLVPDPASRWSMYDLMFHPAVFDVPSLKLLSARLFLKSFRNASDFASSGELIRGALKSHSEEREETEKIAQQILKFLEEVKIGSYPVPTTRFADPSRKSFSEPPPKMETPVAFPAEKRRIEKVSAEIKQSSGNSELCLTFHMTEKLVRKTRTVLVASDTPRSIVEDLQGLGLIHHDDCDLLAAEIFKTVGSSSQR